MAKRYLDFDDFLWLPVFGFKTIGFNILNTPQSFAIKRLMKIIIVFDFFSYLFCYLPMIHQFPSLDFKHNMLAIMVPSGCIAFAINGNIKCFFLVANRKRVGKVYDFLKSIYPKTIEERCSYSVNDYYYTRKELFVIITFFATCGLLAFVPIMKSIVVYMYEVYYNDYYAESSFQYLKFYETEYMINHRNPWTYIFIYLIESAACHYLILSNLGTDLWLVPFSALVRMHLDQISRKLENFNFGMKSKRVCMNENLKNIVEKHQKLMNLHSELKGIFEICMAFNIVAIVGLLCTVAIRVLLVGVLKDFLFLSYLTSAILQFYILCYHGQKLAESSEYVAEAAYKSNWYDASAENKKILLVLMIRTSRPAELEIVGGPPLCLDTFKVVMTVSYRIFTIFTSMME